MKTTKYFIAIMFVVILLFLMPTISNAAEQTYTDEDQNIEWGYSLDGSENVINLRCKTKTVTGSVTIPSTIEEKTVVSLAGSYDTGAFKDCAGLTSVTIPETITKIGDYAFRNCTGLKSITIPNTVTSIGDDAFEGCSGLTSVDFSNTEVLTSIGNDAFAGCSGLRSVTMPNSVITFGLRVFQNCSNLQNITLSNKITQIGRGVFQNCAKLKSLIIPDTVTTIYGEYSMYAPFDGCSNLEKVLIPDSVASIGSDAFYGCKKLTIYGHDEMTSKEFAEANGFKFDYIENWDKEDTSKDITAPTVSRIYVDGSDMYGNLDISQNAYIVPANANLVLHVCFSEAIKGTEVPTLTIKFGNGNNIELKDGTISGSTIVYEYTIKSSDVGTMATVSLAGGNITDETGNNATLTCPTLQVTDIQTHLTLYANGTVTGSNNPPSTGGNTAGGNTAGGNDVGGGSTAGGNTAGGNTAGGNTASENTSDDNSVYDGKLPQTGVEAGIIFALIVLIGSGVFAYFKYRDLKNI